MSKQVFELSSENQMSDSSVAERLAREVYVVGGGVASGLVREIQSHPVQTVEKVATLLLLGLS